MVKKKTFFSNTRIEQNIISYKNKFIEFIDALTKSNKDNYMDALISEGINAFTAEKADDYYIYCRNYLYIF